MTIELFPPRHPRNVGAWVTLLVHNARGNPRIVTKALELAILKPRAWNLGFGLDRHNQYFICILGIIGIVIVMKRGMIRPF